jgi:hypothetical protein
MIVVSVRVAEEALEEGMIAHVAVAKASAVR